MGGKPVAGLVADLEGAERRRTVVQHAMVLLDGLETLEGADHGIPSLDLGGHGIGGELAAAGVGHHHQAGQESEEDLGDHRSDEKADAPAEPGALSLTPLAAQRRVDQHADDPGKEDHEGVQDSLEQGHGDHVAVGDVGHLVGEDSLYLALAHALEQSGTDGDQGVSARGPGGEGVGLGALVDPDLGHGNAGALRLGAHGLHQPLFRGGPGLTDQLDRVALDGHPLGDRQGDQASGEPDHGGERHEGAVMHPAMVQPPVQAEGPDHNRDHHQHRDVGEDEQGDSLHFSRSNRCHPTPKDAGRVSPWRVGLQLGDRG